MANEIELRDRLLIHARDQFFQRGFSKVTVDELASELGMSKKTLYQLYPSKADLLRASIHMTMRGIEKNLERIVASDKPFVEKMAEVMILVGRIVGKMSRQSQIDLQRFAPALWKEIETFRKDQLLNKLGKMILQARDENILRSDVNEHVLIHMLVQSVQGIINPDVLSHHSFSARDAFKSIFTVLLEGALTDDARRDFSVFDISVSNLP